MRAGGRAWWRPRMWEMGAEGGSSRGQQWARGTDGSLQATGQRPRSRSREGEEEEQEGQAETRGRAGRAGRSRTGDEKRRIDVGGHTDESAGGHHGVHGSGARGAGGRGGVVRAGVG